MLTVSSCRNFVKAFIDFPKPLIALVNGPAVGIMVTILGLFDGVYCSDRVGLASFQFLIYISMIIMVLCNEPCLPDGKPSCVVKTLMLIIIIIILFL